MKYLLIALCSVMSSLHLYAQPQYTYPDTSLQSVDPIKAELAKSLVVNYTRLILKGENIDSIINLCAIPFAWDRKKIISDWPGFKKEQEKVIAEKGKNRLFLLDTVYIRATRHEMLDKIVPLDIYYVIIKIRREDNPKPASALFAVQMSDSPKIVGISD